MRNHRYRNIAIAAVACLGLVVTVGWTDFRRSIAQLVAGDLTVNETATITGAASFASTVAVTGVSTVDGITFSDSSDTINGLWTGQVTVSNGSTTNSVTLTGVASGDSVMVTPVSGNTNSVTVKTAAVSTNSVLVTLSGDPGADTTFDVVVIGN